MPVPHVARLAPVLALVVLGVGRSAAAQEISVARHDEAGPTELSASVRDALAPGGTRAGIGSDSIDLWWVKQIVPGTGNPGIAVPWSRVAEGTLVGAVRFQGPFRDIRGRVIKPGVYTLRFAVQPANGDHLGVSPYREFLLVSPAAIDLDHGPLGYDGAVKLSKQAIGGSHPAMLSLDPPTTSDLPASVRTSDAGHKAVIIEVPLEGGESLRFGLVLAGRIEA